MPASNVSPSPSAIIGHQLSFQQKKRRGLSSAPCFRLPPSASTTRHSRGTTFFFLALSLPRLMKTFHRLYESLSTHVRQPTIAALKPDR
jgi:hypothetical protein